MSYQIDRSRLATLFLEDLKLDGLEATVADAFGDACSYPSAENIHIYAVARQVEAFHKKAQGAEQVPEELVRDAILHLGLIERENLAWAEATDVETLPGIAKARLLISQVLPPFEMVEDEVWSLCRFGQGATFLGSGPSGRHTLTKIGGKQTVTRRCFGLVTEVLCKHYPAWFGGCVLESECSIVKGNRLEFVPKDVTKCRTIAVEPSLNMFLQLGVGNYLFRRLRRFGIDLRDQVGNRLLALKGSIGNDPNRPATVDLSDASSRISRKLVKALLPADWFELLDTIRSPGYVREGTFTAYQMFSSQGNGFTFPLETLIFWAITRSVTSRVKVYGDDIIVPSRAGKRVMERLEIYGFRVNREKSYATGPFRESCGADYLDGVFVRPIYYKADCKRYSDIAALHNLLYARWGYLPRTLAYLRSFVPKQRRSYGPFAVWRSASSIYENSASVALDEYFWYPPHWEREQEIVLRRWLVSSRTPRWVRQFSDEALYRLFLYTGRHDITSSDLVKARTTTEVISGDRAILKVPKMADLILTRSFSELLAQRQ